MQCHPNLNSIANNFLIWKPNVDVDYKQKMVRMKVNYFEQNELESAEAMATESKCISTGWRSQVCMLKFHAPLWLCQL